MSVHKGLKALLVLREPTDSPVRLVRKALKATLVLRALKAQRAMLVLRGRKVPLAQ
jgi:hypothetical protein